MILLPLLILSSSLQAPTALQAGALPAPPPWAELKAAYAEQAVPEVKEGAAKPDPRFEGVQLTRLTFTSARGERVTGLLLRPKGVVRPPVALVLHGLGSNKENTLEFFGKALAEKGVACLALDAPSHGERKKAGEARVGGSAFTSVLRGGVADYRQALSHLRTRRDVDGARVGLIGNSMGAMMGAIVAGVDERVKAVALVVGGDPVRPAVAAAPEALRPQIERVSPSNYVGHISPRPVLLVNAREDETIRGEAARRLQDAAREPKEVVWVQAGHVLPEPERRKATDWLAAKLTAGEKGGKP